jgi:hypothetical protein
VTLAAEFVEEVGESGFEVVGWVVVVAGGGVFGSGPGVWGVGGLVVLGRGCAGRDADVERLDGVGLGSAVDAVVFVGGAVGLDDVFFFEV